MAWQTASGQAIGKRFGRLKIKVLKDLGIMDHATYNFHSLRHTFQTELYAADYNELMVADLVGHAKSGVAKTEAGRTYFGRLPMSKLVEMVDAIPPLSNAQTR